MRCVFLYSFPFLCLNVKPWISKELLDMCDKRRELKRGKSSHDGAEKYRKINKEIRIGMKEAKENCIGEQCQLEYEQE